MSARATVEVVQQHLPLLGGDASLQDSCVALFVELFSSDNERHGTVCDPMCFHLVSRERFTDEAIEVWGSLVGWRAGDRLCIFVDFHDLGSGKATGRSTLGPGARDLSVAPAPEPEAGGSLPAYLSSSKWTEGLC
jgi:hypothetical protein